LQALTIHQPWASAIIAGPKRVENRTWHPRRFGLRPPFVLAIHAAKRKPLWCDIANVYHAWPALPDDLPLGAVLGYVRVDSAVPMTEAHRVDPWAVGPFLWKISRVWALPHEHLIYRRGQQAFWFMTGEEASRLILLSKEVGAAPRPGLFNQECMAEPHWPGRNGCDCKRCRGGD